jgi:hypothetical protein
VDEDISEGTTPADEEPEHQEAIQEEPENERQLEMVRNIIQKLETIRKTPLEEKSPIPKIIKTSRQNKPSNVQMKKYNSSKVLLYIHLDLTKIIQLTYAIASVIAETLRERPRRQKQARKQPA